MTGPEPDLSNPLIVQSDCTILLEVRAALAEPARSAIAPFAELMKSPEHVHTYRISPLSVWNARAAGFDAGAMIAALRGYARYPVPQSVADEIEALAARYGMATLERGDDGLELRVSTAALAELLQRDRRVGPLLGDLTASGCFQVEACDRGALKQALVACGYPAEDLAGYEKGDALAIRVRDRIGAGTPFALRTYQVEAVEAFHQQGRLRGGSGVVVLPCGSGKTVVGLAAMAAVAESTLILCTSMTSVRQWRRELLDKTNLTSGAIAEYAGATKQIGPVTLATYQMLTYRPSRDSAFVHFELFHARQWGLVIYDEVHLLPAPVFRVTAELQARRRLGLTATLVREDGREGDVFALIGPKRYDVPWRELERQGFIAQATCTELRVEQGAKREMEYAVAPARQRFRIAAENPEKIPALEDLLRRETGRRVLVIGEYIAQLEHIAHITGLVLVTGKTSHDAREEIFRAYRAGELDGLVLSRVGNFALDLPDAEVLIQVSGKYGSRQEEAQRLGRILRPKRDGRGARFYTLVSRLTCEEDFARRRQRFLTEQGYGYRIEATGA